ncbi:MAG: hypothetical protein E7406_03730 [Ruminococcaceae bacterium]|nr:hypothetical protein [Oscillospiraceae bacterium]
MDRKELLEELKKLKSSDDQILLSGRALNDLTTLSDDNFKYFFEFAKKDLTTRNKKSADQYISTTKRYLQLISNIPCSMENSTSQIIETFLSEHGNSAKDIQNKVSHLKALFDSAGFDYTIDFKDFKPKSAAPIKNISRIEAEKISKAIEEYKTLRKASTLTDGEKDKYTKKQFILEMFFFTPLTIAEIQNYQKEQCLFDNNSIYFKGEKYPVPNTLINLMREMEERNILHGTHYTRGTTEEIQKDLAKFGMEDISSQGAKNTRDAIFWTCPQCGKKYLAIAENWCVKQYTENGENWIVCREICGHE